MTELTLKINRTETFDDNARLVPVYGQGCSHPTGYGVEGFEVHLDVSVIDGEQSQDFHLVMQSADRTNGIMAYNGVEMDNASQFGCDSDETPKAWAYIEDLGYDPAQVLAPAFDKATELCRNWYNDNITDLLSPMYGEADMDEADDLSLAPKVIEAFKQWDDVPLFDYAKTKFAILVECENALADEYKDGFMAADVKASSAYEALVDEALQLVEDAYNELGARGLSDSEILAQLSDTDTVFVNVFDRVMAETGGANDTDEAIYQAFVTKLNALLFGSAPIPAEVLHCERGEDQSVQQHCYAQIVPMVERYLALRKTTKQNVRKAKTYDIKHGRVKKSFSFYTANQDDKALLAQFEKVPNQSELIKSLLTEHFKQGGRGA